MRLYRIKLAGFTHLQRVAVVQSALHEAGFTFINWVPSLAQLALPAHMSKVSAKEVEDDTDIALFLLASFMECWSGYRLSQNTLVPAEAQKIRSPQSWLSSSAGVEPRRESSASAGPGLGGIVTGQPVHQARVPAPRYGAGEYTQPPVMQVAPQPYVFQQPAVPLAHQHNPVPTREPAFFVGTQPAAVASHDDVSMHDASWPCDRFGAQEPVRQADATCYAMPQAIPDQAQAFPVPVHRPFIPQRYLDLFDGTDRLSDRRAWWKEYQYMATFGMWSEAERCRNLELYLRGAAEAWYQQLGAARRSWSTLAAAFTKEFCTSRQSEAERYFTLKQRKGETPREHLWRLNAAARKARIPISTPDDLRHHVSRFIKSLADSDIRVALIGRPFRTLEELERALRAYEEHAVVDEDRR
ncbi:hypothetical protein P43SY_010847 [Pythium insidiosum]|uniref:Retrotransposon gag domain-containing protein n=1 Tax=Pythium insidiosum TaxID=114742 RepID=A0AAD5LZX4_PYTIN|nr:hypothetical protein P43SY_010847 [Pythium insidiosum]